MIAALVDAYRRVVSHRP